MYGKRQTRPKLVILFQAFQKKCKQSLERGVTLSGGQRQRTPLARGFVRDASVLILDDYFSSVDTKQKSTSCSSLKPFEETRLRSLFHIESPPLGTQTELFIWQTERLKKRDPTPNLINKKGSYYKLEKRRTSQMMLSQADLTDGKG